MRIKLNNDEIKELLQEQTGRGGFQSLMKNLQTNCRVNRGSLVLKRPDLEKISRYAFGYKRGGWQIRLRKIFGRTLRAFRQAA